MEELLRTHKEKLATMDEMRVDFSLPPSARTVKPTKTVKTKAK